MERIVAVKKLTKLLGKHLGYRIDPKAPSPEDREVAQAALPAAREERDKLKEQRDARHRAILEGDVEYQRLHAAHKAAREHTEKLASTTRHMKITVGVSSHGFFWIKAEGDSWEDVLEKICAKQNRQV